MEHEEFRGYGNSNFGPAGPQPAARGLVTSAPRPLAAQEGPGPARSWTPRGGAHREHDLGQKISAGVTQVTTWGLGFHLGFHRGGL